MRTVRPWLARLGQARNIAVLACLLALTGATALFGGPGPARSWPVLLSVAAIVALWWRHRAPFTVLALSTTAALATIVLGHPSGPAVLAALIALYTVAATHRRWVSLGAAGISLTGLTLVAATGPPIHLSMARIRLHWLSFLVPLAIVGGCWLIGDNVRVSRAYLRELQAKAARAEADRADQLARAAAQERARIARELHDVVVHHVSVIAVQAGAARMLAGAASPADGPGTWSAIEQTARQALTELRQLLGLLRHQGEPPALAPQPGLDQLDRLLDECRRAGLPVRVRVEGRRVPLDATADLSGYRIIQEALTNVRRHQGLTPTTVVLRYRPDLLEIEVASQAAARPPAPAPAPAPAPEGHGHGLIGMRERVTLLGGQLHAGPRPDGGYTVTARIPWGGDG